MSSYEARTNRDGSTSHRIRFRYEGRNKAIPFDTLEQARSWQAILDVVGPEQAQALFDAPRTQSVHRTVAQQVAHHIEHLTGVEEGTRLKYRKIYNARLAKPFGAVLLGDLSRDHVAAWVNQQTGAPKTIRNAHSLLSGALSSAVRDKLVPANVAKGVRLPKRDADTEEHVYLTHAELATLLPMVPQQYQPLVVFLVSTGVRFGEATALRVMDLDLEAVDQLTGNPSPSARIRVAWKETSGAGYKLGAPKTPKSLRTVGIPVQVVPMLRTLSQGKASGQYVFTNTRGNPIRNGVFHESAWQRLMHHDDGSDGPYVRATGKKPRVHDLRHTYASWAIRANIPLPVIQRQLGHESITTTVDTYGHLVRSDLDVLAGTIGRGLPELTHS